MLFCTKCGKMVHPATTVINNNYQHINSKLDESHDAEIITDKVIKVNSGKDSYGNYTEKYFDAGNCVIKERYTDGQTVNHPQLHYYVAKTLDTTCYIGLFNTYQQAKSFYK